ncbi:MULTISPECIES: hypothetical protein [Pseudomonas]|uniref:hypothetical protein n=1 Tax=Pseudomonas TaxID=286 RepID=UPI0018E8BD34|nr:MULTISPECIES: hypothetical protein [Pseudomonas]MBJ2345829.1 hypothetical protein [Pseudomonas canavaninivorans]MBL3540779.1 hypothetical protein [Pseudomonas sp. HB05]
MKKQVKKKPHSPAKIWNDVQRKVLRHELGHWLVARKLGFDTGDITIKIRQQSQAHPPVQEGDSWINPAPVIKNIDDLTLYLEDRISVLYAGLAAQTHGLELDPVELGRVQEQDAATDLRIIRELVPVLRGTLHGPRVDQGTFSDQCLEALDPIWEKTKDLIATLYPKLDWMADQMGQKVISSNKTYVFTLRDLEAIEQNYPE